MTSLRKERECFTVDKSHFNEHGFPNEFWEGWNLPLTPLTQEDSQGYARLHQYMTDVWGIDLKQGHDD